MARPGLTPAAFYVLLALSAGHAHGYAMMGYVQRITDGREALPAGTLYRTLARLVAERLVAEDRQRHEEASQDEQRRYYRLTERGRAAVRDEAEKLYQLMVAAAEAGVLPSRGAA